MEEQELINEYTKMKILAGQIANHRQTLIELDQRRQKIREAERCLRPTKEKKTFLCMGSNLFIKCPTTVAKEILKDDAKTIEKTVVETRSKLADESDQLLKLEGKPGLQERGFNLNTITEGEE